MQTDESTLPWLPLFGGKSPDSWRARHAHLFPSDESLRHYFNCHRAELIAVGAVVFHRGAYQATELMTPTVRAIAEQAAKRVVAGCPAE